MAEKTYRILSPTDFHTTCSFVLPNRMQCWRAGDEEVSDGRAIYQLCEAHAKIQRAIDAGLLAQAEQQAVPVPPEEPAPTAPQDTGVQAAPTAADTPTPTEPIQEESQAVPIPPVEESVPPAQSESSESNDGSGETGATPPPSQ